MNQVTLVTELGRAATHTVSGCLALTLVVLMMVGCGFQLRGQAQLPQSMATTYIGARGELARELLLLLRGNDVAVVEDKAAATALLVVSNEQLTREVQSVGERARVNEYALHYSLEFELQDSAGETILARRPIELVRDYTLDETQILGVASEEEVIRRELRREMAQEIVRRLQFAQAPLPASHAEN